MNYQTPIRGKDKKKTTLQMKSKRKIDASHYLMRIKATHKFKCDSTYISSISTRKRLGTATRGYTPAIKVSDTIRVQSAGSLNDPLEFKVNLANFSVPHFNSVSQDQSKVQQVLQETKHGLSYESVLRAFSSLTEDLSSGDSSPSTFITSHKHLQYAAGFNFQEFMARAKPLLDYKKITTE